MIKLLLLTSCIIAVIADMLMVWWAKSQAHPLWSVITALVLNSIGMAIWLYTMRKGIESATAITVYALFTVAGCSFLGYYFFGEQLTITNCVGIGLALIALLLMSI